MSDVTTPQEILNLVKRISIDPRSSGRRYRKLRGMVKRCFSHHPQLLDSFVDINGVEALVLLFQSTRPSARYCGKSIIMQLGDICFDLEQPDHGLRLMTELCKTLNEEDSVLSYCLFFLAHNSHRWIEHEKSFLLMLVVNLFKGVDSMLATHVKDPQLEPADRRLFVLSVFSINFEAAGEQLMKNLDIRQIWYSLMDKMSILLPGFCKISLDALSKYSDILRLVYWTARSTQETGALQEFSNFLTERADIFQKLVLMLLDKMRKSWLDKNIWVLQFMQDADLLYCARFLLPAIDTSTTFKLLIDRDNLLNCSKDLLYTATVKQLHGTLQVTFLNEIGYGDGLLREWFALVAEQLMKQNFFVSFGPDKRRILPSRDATKEGDLRTFYFAGQFFALAMINNMQLGFSFDRIMYLAFAGREIGLEDFKDTDLELYLNWKNCTEDVVSEDDETCVQASISEFLESIAVQIEELLKGFTCTIIPVQRKNFFRDIGIRGVDAFLIGDTEDISIKDWMTHTDCIGYSKMTP